MHGIKGFGVFDWLRAWVFYLFVLMDSAITLVSYAEASSLGGFSTKPLFVFKEGEGGVGVMFFCSPSLDCLFLFCIPFLVLHGDGWAVEGQWLDWIPRI